jgi:hypothetical protein
MTVRQNGSASDRGYGLLEANECDDNECDDEVRVDAAPLADLWLIH